jgi:hypothetical protein
MLSCGYMIWLLPPPSPFSPSPGIRLSLFLSLCGGVEGVGVEPNHTTARKHGPLLIIQYSQSLILGVICSARLPLSTVLYYLHCCN